MHCSSQTAQNAVFVLTVCLGALCILSETTISVCIMYLVHTFVHRVRVQEDYHFLKVDLKKKEKKEANKKVDRVLSFVVHFILCITGFLLTDW